ncbi:hypothetical protein RFI_21400 [Reticulomyxa filosa]|uniref:Uncharacterized protein n=1 Tax=Reticulomyxa filosa TaxID=46433 RepID=X6MPP0_RETFI|nr:hypothetical protein RFI_21400 [Reticulomyxa filosa]|eukprot:ETO15958.1 hypothetical protein RFI_21400 [Reticulomyxa filosa]
MGTCCSSQAQEPERKLTRNTEIKPHGEQNGICLFFSHLTTRLFNSTSNKGGGKKEIAHRTENQPQTDIDDLLDAPHVKKKKKKRVYIHMYIFFLLLFVGSDEFEKHYKKNLKKQGGDHNNATKENADNTNQTNEAQNAKLSLLGTKPVTLTNEGSMGLANVKLIPASIKQFLEQTTPAMRSIFWHHVDVKRSGRINTGDELVALFAQVIKAYIASVSSKEAVNYLEASIANLSEDLANDYLNALDNYNETNMDFLDKNSYDNHFVQYTLFPHPMEWEQHQRQNKQV